MRQLLALIRLDLKLFFRDRRALLLLFVIPIGIASFMGALTTGLGGDSGKSGGMQLLLVDLDDSAMSRGVISNFANDPGFRVTVTNEATARNLVLGGRRPVALVLPSGFGANALPGLFDTNRKPVIQLLFDPARTIEKQMVEGMLVPKVLQSVAQNAFSVAGARNLIRQGETNLARATHLTTEDQRLFRQLFERLDQRLARQTNADRPVLAEADGGTNGFSLPLPFVTESQALTRPEAVYNGFAHSFAGMGVQFVMMAMIDLAVTLLKERESGVFRRLRSMPLSRGTLLAAKALSWATISFISLTGCFAFAMLVFQVRVHGSWPGFLGVLASTSLMAGTLGLMLAAVGKTPAGTRGIAIAVILLLVMIGGAWFPAFLFPHWLQTVSFFTPTRWSMDGLDAMTWRGLGFEAAVGPIGMCLTFAAAFGAIAWARFKWDAN